jgi:hypothetical protein
MTIFIAPTTEINFHGTHCGKEISILGGRQVCETIKLFLVTVLPPLSTLLSYRRNSFSLTSISQIHRNQQNECRSRAIYAIPSKLPEIISPTFYRGQCHQPGTIPPSGSNANCLTEAVHARTVIERQSRRRFN